MYWLFIKNPLNNFKRLAQCHPLWYFAYRVLRSIGAAHRALRLLEKGIERKPQHPEWHLEAGKLYIRQGQLDRAAWHYQLANCAVKPDSFISWLEQSCTNDMQDVLGDRVDVLVALGNWYLNAGQPEKALTCYDQVALAGRALSASVLNNKGVALLTLGRTQEALTHFQQVCGESHSWEAHLNTGLTFLKMGRFGDAMKSYEKAQRLGLNSVELLNNKGYALYRMDRYKEALLCLELAQRLDPCDLVVLSNLAACYLRLARHTEGLETCGQGLRYYPRDAALHNIAAVCLEKLQRNNEALVHHDQAVQLDPSNLTFRANRGACLVRLNRAHEAMEIYDRLLAEEPCNQFIWGLRADLLSALGRNNEATEAYNRAMGLTS